MSLFKVCSCWSAQCTDIYENYDSSSLLCYRFGLKENEKDYIAVGSHSGHLSIYYPSCELNENGNFLDYKPTDLLLETNLNSPIISLSAGKLTGTTKTENYNQLAILHPYSLAIYNITTVDGISEHGKQCSVQLLTEHKFNRTAFAVCKGAFGRIKGREFLCVTHMDGTLTFFEQDGISYECFLPGPKALPSVLAYVPRTDSFVRVNFCWELQSFSYQDLSQSSQNNKYDISPTWSICLGEFVLDICSVQITNSRTVIMILGEHNLICLTDEGRFQFIIKLDFSPKCFYTFVVGWYWEPNARLITAIVSESSSLMIYEETKLIWAAQLDEVPVSIQRSNLNNLPGGIVLLGGKGLLRVGYLGSEPFLFKVPPLNLQELNFESAHQELLQLENNIKDGIDITDVEMINSLAGKNLELDFVILPPNIDDNFTDDDDDPNLSGTTDVLMLCSGSIKFITKIHIEQIQIHIQTADAIKCQPSMITRNNVMANSSDLIKLKFYLCDKIHICTNEIQAIVSFITKDGIPRVVTRSAFLPLSLLYKQCPAEKEAAIKLTLTVNVKDIGISTIYSEICGDKDKEIQALGLCERHMDEMVVTIVAAKNSNRFRIQSDCLEAIGPVLEVMLNFVKNSVSGGGGDNVLPLKNDTKKRKGRKIHPISSKSKIVMASPITLPTSEIMLRIDSHHGIQADIRQQTALMDMLWNQFKLFQRSLQSKSENDPVDGLMMLIGKNYDDLIAEGDKLMEMRNTEKSKRNNLSCTIALVKKLINCLNLDERTTELIQSILIYPVEDWTEKSWEETLDPALNMLNHYGPLCRNKNSKSSILVGDDDDAASHHYTSGTASAASNLVTFEIDRFKRHMTSLLERICRLAAAANQPKQIRQQTQNSDTNMDRKQHQQQQENDEIINESTTDDNINENNNDGSSLKNINRLETLPDDEDNHHHDDGNQTEAGKIRESDWTNSEIPPTDILMLSTKRNIF